MASILERNPQEGDARQRKDREIITIYGKPDCALCLKAKEKLALLKLPFAFVDVARLDNWRTEGRVDFLVEKTWREDDGKPELPLLLIDGRWYNYPEAMRFLKDRQEGGAHEIH